MRTINADKAVCIAFSVQPFLRRKPSNCSLSIVCLQSHSAPTFLASVYLGLQQFGVIHLEIRTLKKRHTEQRRTRRFYITAIVRHRGTIGAWRNRGYLRILLMLWSISFQNNGLWDFLKRLLSKFSATRTLCLCRSLCLWHLREIVCFHLRVLPLSVWLLYVVGLLYHSIFRKSPKVSHPQKVGLK